MTRFPGGAKILFRSFNLSHKTPTPCKTRIDLKEDITDKLFHLQLVSGVKEKGKINMV